MITKYGYDVFFTIAAVCVVVMVLALLFIEPKSYRISIIIVSLAVLGFVTNFFRDPERTTPKGENLIIAPADGKVVVVKKIFAPIQCARYFNLFQRISIYFNIFQINHHLFLIFIPPCIFMVIICDPVNFAFQQCGAHVFYFLCG